MNFLKHTPQALTLANLFCGFASIILITDGNHLPGILILFPAFIFDILDGLVARMFGWKSALGGELDSLADEVSFVVAPAIIMAIVFFDSSLFGFIVAGLSISFGTLRLAKFNITKDKGYFQGMSVPYFTTIVIAIYFILFYQPQFIINQLVLGISLIIISAMQVSSVRFPSLKGPTYLKYKYLGMSILLLFAIGLFYGTDILLIGYALQGAVLLVILLPLLLDRQVIKKRFAYLFVALFILISLWADLAVGHPPLILGIPFLYAVIFSPLVQLSIERD